MSQTISMWGATYYLVPYVYLPKSGGGTAKFTDASITTAIESDVTSGKVFVESDGSQGTGSLSFVTYYTSTSAPTSSQGSNGDIWLKTVS